MPNLPRMIGEPPRTVQLRQATVTATVGLDGTATIRFGTGGDTIAGVRAVASASFNNGDTVWVLQQGYDMMILGRVGSGQYGSQLVTPGLEIYHPSSTPFIDFHRAANPAGDSNADFNVRLINSASDTLKMQTAAGGNWGQFRIGDGAALGSYGWDSAWANFGHVASFGASDRYAFMSHSAGEIIVNAWNSANIYLRRNVTNELWIDSAGIKSRLWFRSQTSGQGWYHEVHGGGWFMNDVWIRAYNNKPVYSADRIRALEADMTRWNGSGGHARFGYEGNNHDGHMTRSDGWTWDMSAGKHTLRSRGADISWMDSSGGWCDFRPNIYYPGAGDPVVIGGVSKQIQHASSSIRWKDRIADLLGTDDSPVWKLKPCRYLWKWEYATDEMRHRMAQWSPDGMAGFIAEEVAAVAPDGVNYDGDDIPSSIETWAVLAYTVAGLQHLKQRLDALEGRT